MYLRDVKVVYLAAKSINFKMILVKIRVPDTRSTLPDTGRPLAEYYPISITTRNYPKKITRYPINYYPGTL